MGRLRLTPSDVVGDAAPPPAAPATGRMKLSPDDVVGDAPAPAAPAPEAPTEEPKTSRLEATARGAAQGATAGFSDEIYGLGKALFNTGADPRSGDYFGQKYRAARDSEREANHAAETEHPGFYTGGNVAGTLATSFIPGMGAAKGAGALGTALAAGKLGAARGLGESEATSLGGMAKDAAVTGATSAVTAGMLSRFLSGAPARVADRLAKDAGTTPAAIRAAGDAAAEEYAWAGQPAMDAARRKAEQAAISPAAKGAAAAAEGAAGKPSFLKTMGNVGLAAASPAIFLAKSVALPAAKAAGRAMDARLAQLVTAAANGSQPAQLAERAVKLGFSPVVASAMSRWAFDQAKGSDAEVPSP